MQHRLNLMRMGRVYRAAQSSGWFSMPLSDFVQVPIEDYGERMYLVYPDGSRYAVTDFDSSAEIVTLRRVA